MANRIPLDLADPITFHRFIYELQLSATPRLSLFVPLKEKTRPEDPVLSKTEKLS
jgi:hypothetical protein